jgi:hypothetical protein
MMVNFSPNGFIYRALYIKTKHVKPSLKICIKSTKIASSLTHPQNMVKEIQWGDML